VRVRLDDRAVDVRASTLPTLHGESVVLRLLEAEGRRVGLAELGMAADTLAEVERFCARPHGMLLVTGPTGSGKSTTLHALAGQLRTGREKIVSVEDPIEYELPGVAQVPVHAGRGLTFARALRSILRQDPDVLLVGEMRDAETAEICTQAALTGHLVLSTLHTNDAPGALVRLLDLTVPDYLIVSTVELVLAQRLVRKLCPVCREPAPPSDVARRALEAQGLSLKTAWRGRGCDRCHGTGHAGRTGIYELLVVDDAVRAEFLARRQGSSLRALALERGMRSLRHDGWRQVALGVTSPEEVLRVAQD
jgi:general secretion pathway protein E